MRQVTDTGAIEKAVDEVIAANPDKAEQARAKPTMAGWFVGQVMKATGGKANPQAVNELVKARLGIDRLTAMFVRSAGERDLAAVRALLVETWHATYDAIYGAERVAAITDSWHSMGSLKARLTRPTLGIPGCRQRQGARRHGLRGRRRRRQDPSCCTSSMCARPIRAMASAACCSTRS